MVGSTPRPSRESAGGAVGWLLGQPLYAGVTAAPAVILLTLLAIFGLLLLTGTAIRDVPSAVVGGVGWVRGDRLEQTEFIDDDDDGPTTSSTRQR